MPRRRKGAVRKGHGAICLISGREAGKGGSLSHHVEGTHHVKYQHGYVQLEVAGAKPQVVTDKTPQPQAPASSGADVSIPTPVLP